MEPSTNVDGDGQSTQTERSDADLLQWSRRRTSTETPVMPRFE